MGKYRVIALYIIVLLVMSCVSKKKVFETTVDIQREKVSYVLPTSNVLTIEKLCDTISLPNDFSQVINTSIGETRVKVQDNVLQIEVRTDTVVKDSIVYRDKTVVKEKTTTKIVWSKWTWIFLGVIVIFCVFPGIPKAVGMIATKLIRGF